MRTQILDYIRALNLGTYTTSVELPWIDSGVALYRKNLKKVYVDVDQVEMEPVYTALNGLQIQAEVTIVRVYFASDAKTLPANYEDVVQQIKAARDAVTIEGTTRKTVTVATEFDSDVIITELEFRFTKLLS
jgi:hypothetical protein